MKNNVSSPWNPPSDTEVSEVHPEFKKSNNENHKHLKSSIGSEWVGRSLSVQPKVGTVAEAAASINPQAEESKFGDDKYLSLVEYYTGNRSALAIEANRTNLCNHKLTHSIDCFAEID